MWRKSKDALAEPKALCKDGVQVSSLANQSTNLIRSRKMQRGKWMIGYPDGSGIFDRSNTRDSGTHITVYDDGPCIYTSVLFIPASDYYDCTELAKEIVDSYNAKDSIPIEDQLLYMQAELHAIKRHATMMAEALQKIYDGIGEMPEVSEAYHNVEEIITVYKYINW